MKSIITCILLAIAVLTGSKCHNDSNCSIIPYDKEEILKIRDSLGIVSATRFKKYDLTTIKPITFIRYLSSIEVLSKLDDLSFTSYLGKTLYKPFMLDSKIKDGWVDENSKKELLKLFCSKQPAVPTMNINTASLPEKLSTVGIEAMHLIYYSEGNMPVVSNRTFCPLEKQDSMVKEYVKKYY